MCLNDMDHYTSFRSGFRKLTVPRRQAMNEAKTLLDQWSTLTTPHVHRLIRRLIVRITVHADALHIDLDEAALIALLMHTEPTTADAALTFTFPIRLCQVRGGLRLLVPGTRAFDAPTPDPSLVQLMHRAHDFKARVMESAPETSLKTLAHDAGVSPSYFTRLLRLAYLAPDLTERLLSGRHPPALTAIQLSLRTVLPLEWQAQRALLGVE